mmetsp:Transcript_14861/g.21534  ORF Transcript_14861/g.21534 Transcript_14861/m.21534 type:complete len:940 (-) Transcript_14861:133-2952(-)
MNPTSILSFLAFEDDHDDVETSHQLLDSSNKDTHEIGHAERDTQDRVDTQRPSNASSFSEGNGNKSPLEPATLIYHESARSIVFRDHIRRATNMSVNRSASSSLAHDSYANIKEISMQKQGRDESLLSHLSEAVSTVQVSSLDNKSTSEKYQEQQGSAFKAAISANTIRLQNEGCDNDDEEELSQSSTHDLSSYLGASNNAVQGKSCSASATSSVDSRISSSRSICSDTKPQIVIANYTPKIEPLPALNLEPHNEFQELFLSNPYVWNEGEGPEEATRNEDVWNTMTIAEREVVDMLLYQKCVVKSVKNVDWTYFLKKYKVNGMAKRWLHPSEFSSCTKIERVNKYREYPEGSDSMLFNSFVTSTSLLPAYGLKMRCYGSTKEYTTGVIHALPQSYPFDVDEEKSSMRSNVWAWPSGYSAKTEYNISPYGKLINGREEALASIAQLRAMNHSYIYDNDYEISGRIVKGGLNTLPYNEVFVRVGGVGRLANGLNTNCVLHPYDFHGVDRTFDDGCGTPVALFTRTNMFKDLTALLRLRARMSSILGKETMLKIPLLFICPEHGTRVLTIGLQQKLLSIMSNSLNPFQNPHIKHKTQMNNISESHFQQKLQELLDLDDDDIRNVLTAEECARLAGGFGATDESVANLLMDVMLEDFKAERKSGLSQKRLQNIVNEGISASVRSNDFNTSRQLLILYTLVASRGREDTHKKSLKGTVSPSSRSHRKLLRHVSSITSKNETNPIVSERTPSSYPPPPPLDTDRLRSATNSDGLLSVLGAAEVLKSIQTNAAKKRAMEAAQSIEEWIEKSENSVAYRLASWRDLTTAQDDLKIATENHSNFMAFVSNKAITNRKKFAEQLRYAVDSTNFEGIEFLKSIHSIVSTMHSPCLRLELLQFILGLDNRYSVAHVERSVELAATCLNISATEDIFASDNESEIHGSLED